jgi:phosphoglycolate phosphatase
VRLVLFDVDGTLLWTDGAGRRAITTALTEVFGSTMPTGYHLDGKTDPQIVRDLMRLAGHADDYISSRMTRVLDRYLDCLTTELANPAHEARALAGVPELLDALAGRDDVMTGLLTGNVARGADAKLRRVGIDPGRFVVGAFGSDHEDRPELPAIARRRASERLGVDIAGADVIVIGDTPADLTCGRGIGARAIGVATGRYTVEQLRGHEPAAVFATLSDTEHVMREIVK